MATPTAWLCFGPGCFHLQSCGCLLHRLQSHLWAQPPLVPCSTGIVPGWDGSAACGWNRAQPSLERSRTSLAWLSLERSRTSLAQPTHCRAGLSTDQISAAQLGFPFLLLHPGSQAVQAGLTRKEQRKASTLLQKVGSKK